MRLLLLLFMVTLSSCWITRAYKLRNMQSMDYLKLPYVTIAPSTNPQPFTDGRSEHRQLKKALDSVLASTNTAAFLIIRNDSIIYEKYFNGFDSATLLPSNSMTKSFTGTLAGMAIQDGIVRPEDPVTKYLPELGDRDPRFGGITVAHLLDMRGGFLYNEGKYDLKDPSIRLGLKRNLERQLLRLKIAEPPGRFQYQSINTQLLGLIIERTSGKDLQQYFAEKLWHPLGAETNASWNIDSRRHGMVMTSAGLNATARDFAKIGRLYLNNGMAGGKQILDKEWVATIASRDSMVKYDGYKYQWWSRMASRYMADSLQARAFQQATLYAGAVSKDGDGYQVAYRSGAFHASGFLNQIILIHPVKNIVIVRLGLNWKHTEPFTPFVYNLAERL